VNGIVKVLVEIHNEPDLKLNLKFEIEVLCKELSIDLRSVEVGTYLKDIRWVGLLKDIFFDLLLLIFVSF
jgi:CCR4-NOT transcription complex subunit 1 CAF1-binding domain